MIIYRCALGEDSHAFAPVPSLEKTYIKLAGVNIESARSLLANSDGDVVWHALCRAIQGLTGAEILGETADQLVTKGHTDSSYFLKLALANLKEHQGILHNLQITQISIQIEAKSPKLSPHFSAMRENIQTIIFRELKQNLSVEQIGIAAMTGEGLTSCGQGKGISVKVLLTVQSEIKN